jgi:hypothetical protein
MAAWGGAIVVADRGHMLRSQVRAVVEPLGYRVVHIQSCHQVLVVLRHTEPKPSLLVVALAVRDGGCWDVLDFVERSVDVPACRVAIATTSPAVVLAHARAGEPWPLLRMPIGASELLAILSPCSGIFSSAPKQALMAAG